MIQVYLFTRELRKARHLLRVLDTYVDLASAEPIVRIYALTVRSYSAYFNSSPEECVGLAEQGLALAAKYGIHAFDLVLAGQGILGHLLCGDIAASRDLAQRYLPMVQQVKNESGFFLFNAGAVSLVEGDLIRAQYEAEQCVSFAVSSGVPFGSAHSNIFQAMVRGKNGETQAALEQIEITRATSPRVNSPVLEYCSFLAEANVHHWRGKPHLALAALESALDVAKQDCRIFVPGWQPREEASILFNCALQAGIHVNLVCDLIRKLRLPPPDLASDVWPFPVKIYTLGRFLVLLDDIPLESPGKKQKKPLELLKAVIAMGGSEVGIDALAQVLWPDTEGDKARHVLIMTRSRLHKLLGHDILALDDGRITLNSALCWVDVPAFERGLEDGRSGADHAKAIGLYQGHFMVHEDPGWALPTRERLRDKFSRGLVRYAQQFEENGDLDKAAGYYRRGIDTDPLTEEFYRSLMRCYTRLERYSEAQAVYQRCRRVLNFTFGIEPGPETKNLYDVLLRKG